MKKCAVFIVTIALFTTSAATRSAGQQPNAAQPAFQQPALPPSAPGVIPPAPAPGTAPAAEAQTNVTITISRTIVNPPDAITIIGTASSEQEKQEISTKLQEILPGRVVNNQLVVSGQSIIEPSGAERDSATKAKRR